jgi:hypothetical protein
VNYHQKRKCATPDATNASFDSTKGISSSQWSKGTKLEVQFKIDNKIQFLGGTVTAHQPASNSVEILFDDADLYTYSYADLDKNCTVNVLQQKPSIQRTNTLLHLLSKCPDLAVLNAAFKCINSSNHSVGKFKKELNQMVSGLMNAEPDSEIRKGLISNIVRKFQQISSKAGFQNLKMNDDFKFWVQSIFNFEMLDPAQNAVGTSVVDLVIPAEDSTSVSANTKRSRNDSATSSAIGAAQVGLIAAACPKGKKGSRRSADIKPCVNFVSLDHTASTITSSQE